MKKIISQVLGVFLLFSCSQDDVSDLKNQDLENGQEQKLLSIDQINTYIDQQLNENGDVDWTHAPTAVLWSAVVHGSQVLSVGYGTKGKSFSVKRSPELNTIKAGIFKIIQSHEKTTKSTIQLSDDDILNVIDVKITAFETIRALQEADHIRYLDPIGYSLYTGRSTVGQKRSDSGCDQSGNSINTNDYSVIAPNAWLPWSYDIHNIAQAWSYSTGANITVGLIDTGISTNQYLLGNGFNDGDSNGRVIEKFGTFIDSVWPWSNNLDGPNDKCGHGTSMGAVIASPRNNDFMPVGVAYNCNLVAYRGTEDVVLNDYHERKGVSDALKALGNRSDLKIISMSIGYPWSIGVVKDAVKYVYGKGKMIIAAGGTSTSLTTWYGVIFPANMSETVAVTGIKDNGYNSCDTCHYGSEIDFTIVMERAADANRKIPVLGFNSGDRDYVGGSSIATATTAGIAALVWARNPSMTRDQVLHKLKQSAEFYPNRNGDFGYGKIDALLAVQ